MHFHPLACLAALSVLLPYGLSINSLAKSDLIQDFGVENNNHSNYHYQYGPDSAHDLVSRQNPVPPEWLRIMPLGASIVRGLGSTPEDGFRKVLRAKLRAQGFQVNMVGSMSNPEGSMKDGDHEGHTGHRIDQIIEDFDRNRNTRPNLVLINAGTNDCQQNHNGMRDSMNNLKDLVYLVKRFSPETTIILSTLLPSNNEEQAPGANARVTALNQEIRKWVWSLPSREKVLLAEMNDDIFILRLDLVDGIHPTGQGYRKMASVWFEAIQEALRLNMITEPLEGGEGPDDSPSTECDKVPGQGDGPHLTQRGFGYDDGPYRHKGTKVADLLPRLRLRGKGAHKRVGFGHVISNDLNYPPSAALDEIIVWNRLDVGNGQYLIRLSISQNAGDGTFFLGHDADIPFDCPSEDIRWADINGDVLDDFVCVESNGDVRVAVTKRGSGGRAEFHDVGIHMRHPAGYEGRHVRLGDIDGDGRADYCVIGDDGLTHCWRNGGLGDKAEYWQDFGMTFAPKGKGDIRGTRFVDINGDFRSDWIWVGDRGETDIYTNMRGPRSGASVQERLGLVPHWLHAESFHGGMNVPGIREQIHFARIFSKDGSGRRDYVYIEPVSLNNGDDGDWDFYLRAWRNDGSGGTQRKSDWDRYGDITGDGKDDYLQIRPSGDVEVWININQPGEWDRPGVIHNIGAVDPKAVHVADWNGDGKADILILDKESGRITWWPNRYSGPGSQFFTEAFRESQSFGCAQGWGVGIFDLGVRFADLDGDGRADYLCMEQDGRTEAVLNGANGPEYVGQIKFSEKKDRANHRFADVNGDGKADFLWIDKWNGDVHVWYNQGRRSDRPEDGSIWQWLPKGKLYNGVERGPNEYFIDYDGDGRADILRVNPEDNSAEVWYNKCSGGGGGVGDDSDVDTNTPKYPGDLPDLLTCPDTSLPCRLSPLVCGDEQEDLWDTPIDKPPYGEEPEPPPAGAVRRHAQAEPRGDDSKLMPRGEYGTHEWILYSRFAAFVLSLLRYMPYPSGTEYVTLYQPSGPLRLLMRYVIYDWGSCDVSTGTPTVEINDVVFDQDRNPIAPMGAWGGNIQSDHTFDRGLIQIFINDVVHGRVPSRSTDRLPQPVPNQWFQKTSGIWDRPVRALLNKGPVGLGGTGPSGDGGTDGGRPSARLAECFGSEQNMYPMVMLDPDINAVKGRVMAMHRAWNLDRTPNPDGARPLLELTERAAATDNQDLMNSALHQIRLVIAMFEYLNLPDVRTRYLRAIQDATTEWQNIEETTRDSWRAEHPGLPDPALSDWWRRWTEDHREHVTRLARQWIRNAVGVMRRAIDDRIAGLRLDGRLPTPMLLRTLVILTAMEDDNLLNGLGLPR